MNRFSTLLTLPVALCSFACGSSIEPMIGLPVASLACPTAGAVGVPFTIDPTTSSDAEGAFSLVELDVNGDKRTELLAQSFSVDYPGIVVASLKITDADQHVARATCRFLVDGPALDTLDPIDDGDGDGDDDPIDDGEDDVDPIEDAEDNVDPIAEPDSLTGSFAMVGYDMAQLEGGGLDPAMQCMPAPSVALVDLVEGEGELTMTLTWCHLEIPDVQLGAFGVQNSEIPDTTTELFGSLGPATFPYDGAMFSPPLDVFGRALLAGATNETGPLPDNNEANSVANPDGDANQGVPIFVGNAFPLQLNVAMRRTITALSGTVASNSFIDGSVDGSYRVTTEINTLDAGFTSGAQPETSTALPSRFQMTRLDDNATCATVIARQASLLAALQAPAMPTGCFEPAQE